MSQDKDSEKTIKICDTEYTVKKERIHSELEVVFDEASGVLRIDVIGENKKDKDYIYMNRYGNGAHHVEIKTIFSVINSANKLLSLIRIKDNE